MWPGRVASFMDKVCGHGGLASFMDKVCGREGWHRSWIKCVVHG